MKLESMRDGTLAGVVGLLFLAVVACGGETGDARGANAAAGGADANAAVLDWSGMDGAAGAPAANAGTAGQTPDPAAGAGEARPEAGEIVVENGVRYRAGPNDARVRVDANGSEISVDTPDPDMPPGDDGR